MKKTYILFFVLILTASSAFAQVDGEKPAREFLSDEFFPAFNHWSDEAQKSKDLGNLAERAVMKLLFVSKVENSQINDELTRANTNKTGWYMFFKDRTSYGMPFHCEFQSAELKRHNGKGLWFYVTYTVDYVDKTDWSDISSYNPNSSLFVRKRITVHDYMLVEASKDYIVVMEVADHLPNAAPSGNNNASQPSQPVVVNNPPSQQTTPPANTASNQTIYANGVPIDMIYVQHGTFTMGATPEQGSDYSSDEKPSHSVTLTNDYYIGKYEVTQKLWKAVMGSNPSNFKGDYLPVEQISWNDVQEFLRKLNSITGRNFRLPTETEWEFAARGGTKSRGYKYSGSNDVGSVAWDYDNSGSETHTVGTKPSNELGIYDMAGNVWEWCQDWYDSGYYNKSPSTNPTGVSTGSYRVIRGGGWFSYQRFCRVSHRRYYNPDSWGYDIGFRLAL